MSFLFRGLVYIFYIVVAKHLPASTSRFFGGFFKWVRAMCASILFKTCGSNINIERGVDFGSGGQLEIGDYSGIGLNCQVPFNIKIGKYVMMGPDVVIFAQNHRYDRLDTPMMFQGFVDYNPVVIEDDVWIGARVVILPGIKIGTGAIIGAASIVTKDVPPYAIVAGNPARIIKMRK